MKNNLIIIVDRQFASGGYEICKLLSKKLNIPIYSKAVIREAIVKRGFDPSLFDNAEEIANNSLIYSLSMGIYAKDPALALGTNNAPLGHSVNQAQSDIVKELSEKGSCIFIGCCADYILRENKGCFKVFIKANMDYRIKRANSYNSGSKDIGENDIRRHDRQRENYHNCFADGSFGAVENYHLCLDSSAVGIDNSSKIIENCVDFFLSNHDDVVIK